MPNVMTSGTAEKSAGDRVRLPIDFGDEPLLIDGVTIVNGALTLVRNIVGFTMTTGGGSAPSVTNVQKDYPYQISGLFSGGSPGTYDVTCTITLNDPDATVISRIAPIRVL
jgi:hypothetical protein